MELLSLTLGTLLVAQLGATRGGNAADVPRRAETFAPKWPGSTTSTAVPQLANATAAAAVGSPQNDPSQVAPKRAASVTPKSADIAAPPAKPASLRAVNPEAIASLFAAPASGSLVGRPTSLLEGLSTTTDRARQLAITHAYWRLSAALGQYQVQFDALQRLRRLEPRPDDVALVRVARSKTTEVLRRVELDAVRAQQGLTDAAPSNAGVPLPADLPHAGPYRTNFDEVYAQQNVPAGVRLIHRTLPLRRQGIDARAAAVQAAEDAWETAVDGYRAGAGDLAGVVACMADLVEQRMALVADVCQYNDKIADYAFSVAAVHASPRDLAAMLVFPASPAEGTARQPEDLASPPALPAKRAATSPPSSVQPAAWDDPVGTGRTRLPAAGQPTLAPSRSTLTPASPAVLPAAPAAVPPKPIPEFDRTEMPSLFSDQPSGGAKESGLERTAPAAPRAAPDVPGDKPNAAASENGPTARTARRPIGEVPAAALNSSAALYPGLVSSAPAARAKHLTTALHWHADVPADAGRAVELEACLRSVSASDRRAVIDAYWVACQRAAEYRAWTEQGEWIDQLVPLALDHRQQPSGALDMLRLRVVRLASDAEAAAARVEFLQAQFELTRRTGQSLDGPWLVPSTVPHSGPYMLKLEAQRPELVQLPATQRLAAAVPALGNALQEQAAAVVEADGARAAAVAAYQLNGRGIEPLLGSVRSQTVETLAFLQMVSGYNRLIAQYALTVLPPAISGEQFVQALVIVR